jgi:hypothetical protein
MCHLCPGISQRWEMGDGPWEIGHANGPWEMGHANGPWEMGHGPWQGRWHNTDAWGA